VSVNGTLVEDKMPRFKSDCAGVHPLASTRFPYTLTTVQAPNLALTHTKPDNSVDVSDSEVWLGSFSLYLPTYSVLNGKRGGIVGE
jgi:hypothetical protein